jgi:hypothetical protein
MQYSIMLGTSVRCADGKIGKIGGLIINPTRRHVDYVILQADAAGGDEYFVPSGQIQRASERELTLPCSWSDLADLPHPDRPARQGTLFANLPDLVVARQQTPVRVADGERLGMFQGAIIDADLEIHALLLADQPSSPIPIRQLLPHTDGASDMVVQPAQPEPEGEVVPSIDESH